MVNEFQHTAARRRLAKPKPPLTAQAKFQHTAARRRLGRTSQSAGRTSHVSTHSRPKAAGGHQQIMAHFVVCFNTQPPEGGWDVMLSATGGTDAVSTHSRPKAAGPENWLIPAGCIVSTHSRPKAAGMEAAKYGLDWRVSTHSRPKAAGARQRLHRLATRFQHTAARRRLETDSQEANGWQRFNTQPPEGGWRQ